MNEQYSDEHRAAAFFFALLGKPEEHRPNFQAWLNGMREIMAAHNLGIDEMKAILKWAVEVNSRKYLLTARDPMATLKKNFGNTLKFWRVEHPPMDPDPLWEKVKIPLEGGEPLEQQRLRRKPRTGMERAQLIAMMNTPGKSRKYFVEWLAQDKCPRCHGRGGLVVKDHPNAKTIRRSFLSHWEECPCVTNEEVLK